MNCRDLESELTAYLDGELIAEARVEFEAHLAGCARCSQQIETERYNLDRLKALAKSGSPTASDRLRSAIALSLDADIRRSNRRQLTRFSAIAAAISLLALVGNRQYRSFQRKLYEQDAVARHARLLPLEFEKGEAGAIEQWFGGKLDYHISVPRFPNAQATGGRLLQVRDKPAAYIRYQTERQPMGLFVFGDDNDVDVGAEPAVGLSRGFHVVTWRQGDVVYQLVTDLDEPDVQQLVTPRSPRTTPSLDVRPASMQR